jgi:hypothetical protein
VITLKVLREEFQRRGWVEGKKRTTKYFDFKWSWTESRLNVDQDTSQIVNHFNNFDEVGSKSGLIKNLKRLQGMVYISSIV